MAVNCQLHVAVELIFTSRVPRVYYRDLLKVTLDTGEHRDTLRVSRESQPFLHLFTHTFVHCVPRMFSTKCSYCAPSPLGRKSAAFSWVILGRFFVPHKLFCGHCQRPTEAFVCLLSCFFNNHSLMSQRGMYRHKVLKCVLSK